MVHVSGRLVRSRRLGIDRKTVSKMLAFSVPPGYRRGKPPARPKLDPFTGIIDRILEEDRLAPRKQRHTAKRIHERLRDEHGFEGGYTIVKDYVRERQLRTREMLVPLSINRARCTAFAVPIEVIQARWPTLAASVCNHFFSLTLAFQS